MAMDTEEEISAAGPKPSQGHCPHRTSHVTIGRLALLFAYNQTYSSTLAKPLLNPPDAPIENQAARVKSSSPLLH